MRMDIISKDYSSVGMSKLGQNHVKLVELMFELHISINCILLHVVYQELCHKILLINCLKIECHSNCQPVINKNHKL